MDRLGRSDAAWTLDVSVDTLCTPCADQIEEVFALLPEVRSGTLAIRLLPISNTGVGETAAGAMLAGGCLSEDDLVQVTLILFRGQSKLVAHRDVLDAVTEPVRQSLAAQRQVIEATLSESRQLRIARAATTTPVCWLVKTGASIPVRTFTGLTTATVIRRAIKQSDQPGSAAPPP